MQDSLPSADDVAFYCLHLMTEDQNKRIVKEDLSLEEKNELARKIYLHFTSIFNTHHILNMGICNTNNI